MELADMILKPAFTTQMNKGKSFNIFKLHFFLPHGIARINEIKILKISIKASTKLLLVIINPEFQAVSEQ